jgi:hypothetical protein
VEASELPSIMVERQITEPTFVGRAPTRPVASTAASSETSELDPAPTGTGGAADDPPPASSRRTPLIGLGVALLLSLLVNAGLAMRGPTVVHDPPPPAAVCPPAVTCPPEVTCPTCAVCEACEETEMDDDVRVATAPAHPRPPRVDEAAAAEGEAHLAHAETAGERDPVEIAAQRRVADGVDRIVASHSAAMARRFFSRNLPAFASMDCAFRDPAAAEHIRLQLRPMNELLPAAERLDDAQLQRFERDLRCPRE